MMLRPCWLLFHRWRPTGVEGHANACDFELDACLTCGAYRLGVWFEMARSGEHYALPAAEAHRFLMAAGPRERSALFELWYDRSVEGSPTPSEGLAALFGAPDSPLCCAAPDWEVDAVDFARIGGVGVDLERCRACGAHRLATYWPKDSSVRARGPAARLGAEDAARLRAADWGRRRELLEAKGWYGLER